jgi:hypothetical protein
MLKLLPLRSTVIKPAPAESLVASAAMIASRASQSSSRLVAVHCQGLKEEDTQSMRDTNLYNEPREVEEHPRKDWLVRDFLGTGEMSALYGMPGTAKSALAAISERTSPPDFLGSAVKFRKAPFCISLPSELQ